LLRRDYRRLESYKYLLGLGALVLLALPAAGAAALVAFVLSSVVFGMLGLIGAVGDAQASFLELLVTVGAAFLAALFLGAVGAGIGCLVGLVVGLINDRARGFDDTRRTDVARGLKTGASAVLLWSGPFNTQVLEDELRRLGGEPRTLWPGQPEAETFTGGQTPASGNRQEKPSGPPEASSDE
jgi:hypothetical protein